MTKKPVLNAPPPFEPLRGLSLPRSQSNGAQVHQVHKPDWSMWSGDQRVDIEEAVALTMDIDPTPLLRVQDLITSDALPEDRRADFSKRQAALKRKFNGRTSSMLSDAVHYATQKEWSGLPPELVAMATVPPDTTPRGAKADPESAPTAPAEPVPAKRKFAGLPDDPLQKRSKLLEWFRAAGGKRPKEGGRGGTRGALTRVVEKSGIDKDTLGSMLDKAIDEKRASDGFAQLTAIR